MAAVGIGGKVFRTKSDATAFFKAMLARYRPGTTVSDEDALMLRALIERHPERDQKVDVGISGFYVDMATMGTKCFWLKRIDGTKTHFSYPTCVRGTAPSARSQAISALRRVVDRDIVIAKRRKFDELKDDEGKVECPATGESLGWEDVHADHQQPMTFEVICTTFAAARKLKLEDLPISYGPDNQPTPTLTDETLGEAFRQYHHGVLMACLEAARGAARAEHPPHDVDRPAKALVPTRTLSVRLGSVRSRGTAAMMARLPRTARSASSSCAAG